MYRVGDLCIDEDLFEIRRRGNFVAVEPQALDLILYLLNNRHRVVPKQELVERLWQGRRVTQSALTRCVCMARKSLGTPSLIKTVYKRGYRWNATPADAAPFAHLEAAQR